jgi:hypothetical protein
MATISECRSRWLRVGDLNPCIQRPTDAAGPICDPLQRRRDERSDDLADRFEVIVKRAIRDVRLLGDIVDGRAIDSFAPKNEFGRGQDGFACPLAPALIAIRKSWAYRDRDVDFVAVARIAYEKVA